MKSPFLKPTLLAGLLAITSPQALALGGNCAEGLISASNDLQQFVQFDNGLTIDATTNLMWATCSVGQGFEPGGCSGSASSMSWSQSLQAVEQLNADGFLGFADWRMPNVSELDSIVERACTDPTIDLDVWPGTPSAFFHSSTPDTRATGDRFAANRLIDFSTGLESRSGYDGLGHIRLVRDLD